MEEHGKEAEGNWGGGTKLDYEALMIKQKQLTINKCWHDFKNVCNLGEKASVH